MMMPPIARIAGQIGLVWSVLAIVMSANGIFRELVIRRLVGDRPAAIVSAALGMALLLLVTRALFPRLDTLGTRALALVSVSLVVATVVFETLLGRVVDHKSWSELVGHYALWRGELWPIVLSTLALTPFIWGRWWPVVRQGR